MSDIIAVIDLGSNSFRLQISEISNEVYKVIDEYKEVPRVGDIVYKTGIFTDEAVDTIIHILKKMRIFIDKFPDATVRVVGTALFRDAENTEDVIERVSRATGFNIEVISGEDEARYTYLAASSYINLSKYNALFVDIGGGSMEMSYSVNGSLVQNLSLPLGCSRITQRYVASDGVTTNEEIKNMKKEIDSQLKKIHRMEGVNKVIFTGGTVNMLAQVYCKRNNTEDGIIKHVDAGFIKRFIVELAGKSYEERAKIPGVEAERADISLAAALIVHHVLKTYALKSFFSFAGGLRNGITIDTINKMGIHLLHQLDTGDDLRYVKLIETGRKYSFEEPHALQVTRLARILFTQLYKLLKLEPDDWRLLEAAAILHDVGQYISYSEHHKHSHYLISNIELVGYNRDEIAVIADVARYHRKSLPSNKHPEFNLLSNKDKNKVKKLAAILRLADGLDSSHTQSVESVFVSINNGTVIFNVKSHEDVGMEIDGLNIKKDLFEKVSGKKTSVNVVN